MIAKQAKFFQIPENASGGHGSLGGKGRSETAQPGLFPAKLLVEPQGRYPKAFSKLPPEVLSGVKDACARVEKALAGNAGRKEVEDAFKELASAMKSTLPSDNLPHSPFHSNPLPSFENAPYLGKKPVSEESFCIFYPLPHGTANLVFGLESRTLFLRKRGSHDRQIPSGLLDGKNAQGSIYSAVMELVEKAARIEDDE